MLFVTDKWEPMGTRASRADVIARVTSIPVNVLNSPGAFAQASVIDRLLWARERETTRIEDRAYSLMGLFGVNMPTIYGEGEHAFRRLQEEILKTSSDQTLFSWGVGVGNSFGDDMESGSWPPGLLAPDFEVLLWNYNFSLRPEPLPLEKLPDAVETFVEILDIARKSRSTSKYVKTASDQTCLQDAHLTRPPVTR